MCYILILKTVFTHSWRNFPSQRKSVFFSSLSQLYLVRIRGYQCPTRLQTKSIKVNRNTSIVLTGKRKSTQVSIPFLSTYLEIYYLCFFFSCLCSCQNSSEMVVAHHIRVFNTVTVPKPGENSSFLEDTAILDHTCSELKKQEIYEIFINIICKRL